MCFMPELPRTDYGCPGYAEPEEFLLLCGLVLSEGFRTSASLPGVERLTCMVPDSAFLEAPPTNLSPLTTASQVLR